MEFDKLFENIISNNQQDPTHNEVMEAALKAGYTYGPVFHGTRTGGFTSFDKRRIGTGVVGNTAPGFYFSSRKEQASYFANPISVEKQRGKFYDHDIQIYGDGPFYVLLGDKINHGPFHTTTQARQWANDMMLKWNKSKKGDTVFEDERLLSDLMLKITHPLIVDDMGEFRKNEQTATQQGYDAIIGKDVVDGDSIGDVYLVFNPSQIKSIVPHTYDNQGIEIPLPKRFNPNSDDIRY